MYSLYQNAGGFVINSGSKATTSYVTMRANQVSAGDLPDRTYQCYGACALTTTPSPISSSISSSVSQLLRQHVLWRRPGLGLSPQRFQGY
jgi:hypothetical protein